MNLVRDAVTSRFHHEVVAQPSPKGRRASAAHPGDAMEKGGGILKGCDRTDFAPSSHVVSRTSAEWMDRV